MSIRIYKLEGGGGAKGAALAIVIVGIGALLVAFGVALLLVLGTVGAAIGAAVILYRRLTGRPVVGLPRADGRAGTEQGLEVFAPDALIADRPIRDRPESLPPG
jgi:hypothetical protein